MFELCPNNTADYLRRHRHLGAGEAARVEALAWGVSNVVLRVTPEQGPAFVVKQSRAQLRTKDPWFSRLDRIWREVGVMRTIEPLLPRGVVPRVLFEDRENYLFAMEAAPADHFVWKQLLLEGQADAGIAAKLGTYLADIHRGTALDSELQRQWGDTEVFVQLRVDPFYRRIAAISPEIGVKVDAMVNEMFATAICLVHADFSPKNVLISSAGVTLVDFETGHYGDPAFDLGFFLSHLLLKTVLHRDRFAEYAGLTTAFWRTYLEGMRPLDGKPPFAAADLERRTFAHLAGCMWARIDATSKIDYLPEEASREQVRVFCRTLFLDPPPTWKDALGLLQRGTR